jgi:hypothetical protein
MIARLCLSDLHLGDPRSTLSNPEVAAEVASQLVEISGGKITELVLNGDVWEECVPGNMDDRTDGIATSVLHGSQIFFGALFEKIEVGKMVYVPGNHDLSLWRWYRRTCLNSQIANISYTCTPYSGMEIDRSKWPWNVLFGTSWSGELVASYPIYWDRSAGSDYPLLVFTHGHLLDPLVRGCDPEAEYVALAALGCRRPALPPDLAKVSALAEAVENFCSSLWARYSRRDNAFFNYVMRRLECPQSCQWQDFVSKDGFYSMQEQGQSVTDQPPSNQGRLGDVPWFLDLLLGDPDLPSPVGEIGRGPVGGECRLQPAFSRPSCLVYGHDHLAARRTIFAAGVPFTAVGSGGWTSEHDGHLPHSHVLVWPDVADVVPRSYFLRARTIAGQIL